MSQGYFQNERREMLDLLPPEHKRVLEIGCGEGRFIAALAGVAESWGVEPHAPAAAIAAQTMTRVLPTSFEAAEPDLPAHYFDLVICNDVIEHMDDHDAFFRRIQRYMAPGASIIGSVPNVRYYRNLFDVLVLKDWDYKDAGVLDRTHKRFFTQKSLRRSLQQSGMQVQCVQGINAPQSADFSRGQARYTLFRFALIGLSLGYEKDAAFMQLAFRAAVPAWVAN